jgi:hypothetical protein
MLSCLKSKLVLTDKGLKLIKWKKDENIFRLSSLIPRFK